MSESVFSPSVLAELRAAFPAAVVERTISNVADRVSRGLVTGSPDNYLVAAVRNAATGTQGGFSGRSGAGASSREPEQPKAATFREDGGAFPSASGAHSATHVALDGLLTEMRDGLLTPAEAAGRVRESARLCSAVSPAVLEHWDGLPRLEQWQGAGVHAARGADAYLAGWGGRAPWHAAPEQWQATCLRWRELSGVEPEECDVYAARAALDAFAPGAGRQPQG